MEGHPHLDPTSGTEPRLYVVVCTHFHVAYGVFTSPQQALERADELNTDPAGACQYVPVSLAIDNGRISSVPPGAPGSGPVRHGEGMLGGYL